MSKGVVGKIEEVYDIFALFYLPPPPPPPESYVHNSYIYLSLSSLSEGCLCTLVAGEWMGGSQKTKFGALPVLLLDGGGA